MIIDYWPNLSVNRIRYTKYVVVSFILINNLWLINNQHQVGNFSMLEAPYNVGSYHVFTTYRVGLLLNINKELSDCLFNGAF